MCKKGFLVLTILVTLLFAIEVFGWIADNPTGEITTREHYELSSYLTRTTSGTGYMPYLKPYVLRFGEVGLDRNEILRISNTESYPHTPENWIWEGQHWIWADIDDLRNLYKLPLTNESVGAILHAAEDSGVSAGHRPASYSWPDPAIPEEHDAEVAMEVGAPDLGYYQGSPVLGYSDILRGNFFEKRDAYEATASNIANIYEAWYMTNHTALNSHISSAMMQSLRASVAGVAHFLDYYEVTEPGSTIAHWDFDEGSGQVAVNSKGSISTNLQLGSSTYNDSLDPAWGDGYVYCNGDYLRNHTTWTPYEADSIAPYSSYTIEIIFKPTVLANGSPTLYGGILSYTDTAPSPDIVQYIVKAYKKSISGTYRPVIEFYAEDPGGVSHTITLDTTTGELGTGGMVINKWYYLAAIFHITTGTMDVILRDLETGKTVATLGEMRVSPGFGSSATPLFTIGVGPGNNYFKGYIDDVRISNRALVLDADRLYSSTIGHWRFDEEASQIVHNTQGVDADLQRGSNSEVDDYDLMWGLTPYGYWGGAGLGFSYVENGNHTRYARSTTLSSAAAKALAPSGSYSLEAVFNVSGYPTTGGTANTRLGILAYRDYAPAPDITQYRLCTYIDTNGKTHILYWSMYSETQGVDIDWNTTDAGLTIATNHWYYIGAFFDVGTYKINFYLRDMESTDGVTVTSLGNTMYPMYGLSASPNPIFLLGTQNLGSECFNGVIDEVRVSNSYLAEKDRLYRNGSTVAHWKFDYDYATAGQLIDNADNDLLLNFHLGNQFNLDNDDRIIAPSTDSWFGGSLYGKSYAENGNNCVYVRSPDTYDEPFYKNSSFTEEAPALVMNDSYTIEAVFKIESYPTTGGTDNTRMGILAYRDYAPATDITQYRIGTYKQDGDTYISFYSMNTPTSGTTIKWNTTEENDLSIDTDVWYYVGAFFDATQNKMKLTLRNMATGATISKPVDQTMYPMYGLSISPNPIFLIGSQNLGSECFDGYIDEVRISNKYLPEDCRLYNYPR